MRLVKTKKSFRKEFKRQLRYAIAAAVGFMIVFVWKETIINATKDLVEKFVSITQVATTETSTALLITIIGVFIILITSRLLKD